MMEVPLLRCAKGILLGVDKYLLLSTSHYGDIMNLNFVFTLDQTNIILAALGKQTFETVAPIIDSIRQQAQPQLQAAEQQESQPEA